MSKLQIWFFDVGHGDCAYLRLPNGARMMIDCGGGDNHWPSLLLKHSRITAADSPIPIPGRAYGIDNLVITHLHGDHISDIKAIHEQIGFFILTGGYSSFIDRVKTETIDWKERGRAPVDKFREIVKSYVDTISPSENRVELAKPTCIVEKMRFLNFEDGIDMNELSWFVSFQIGNQKVLFTGDMTGAGVRKILQSKNAEAFKRFVKGTTILKIPHHARLNGCSQEMFDCFGAKPLVGVASDEELNDRNEETCSVSWYSQKISDNKILIDGEMQNRKVLTTRSDGDIYLEITEQGSIAIQTHCLQKIRDKLLNSTATV